MAELPDGGATAPGRPAVTGAGEAAARKAIGASVELADRVGGD